MSYEIIKGITIKRDKVYLTSADSSVRPLDFHQWECETLSQTLSEDGREALLARIGKNVWEGDFRLNKGNKLCDLFLKARSALPGNLSWHNYYGETAGEYLAKMVLKLENDPSADLSDEIGQMLERMNDRQYIFEAARVGGYNYLNYADEALQHDKKFALEVLHAGGNRAWFDYPIAFVNDKEFALEALNMNGCFYRNLDNKLQADRDVILAAFSDTGKNRYHEHLPDLIPITAYCERTSDNKLVVDTGFICNLLDVCPSLHMHRAPWLINQRDIALAWCKVGKFFPYDMKYLSEEFLSEKETQDILLSRFEGTDKYDVFINKLEEKGVTLHKGSLGALLADATQRSEEMGANTLCEETKDIDFV